MPRIIAGPNPVEEAIRSGASRIQGVYLLRGLKKGTADKIFSACRKAKIKAESVEKSRLDDLAPDLNHQGVVAIAGEFGYTDFDTLLMAESNNSHSLLVILDQIQDPGNLGAIVRSARSFGAQGVVITKDRSAPMTSAAVRGSAGASEHIPVARIVNLANALDQVRELGYTIFGADAKADSQLDDIEWPHKTALVMGSEGKGLRRLTRDRCDTLFAIPMRGGFESLNVSAAAAIALYRISTLRG